MKPEQKKPQKRKRPKTKATNPQECTKEATSSSSDGTAQQQPSLTAIEPEKSCKTRKRKDAAGTSRSEARKPKSSKSQTKKSKLVPETDVVVHITEATESSEECDKVLPEGTEKEENKLTPEEEQELVKKEKRRKVQTRVDDNKTKAARKKTAKEDSEIEVVVHKTEATKSLEECDQVLPEGTEKEENKLTPEEEQELVKKEKRRKVQTRVDDKKPKAARKKTAKEDSEIEVVVHKTEATKSLEECDQVLPEETEKEENKLTPEEEQELVKKDKRRKVQTRGDDKKPKAAGKKTAKEDSEIEVVVHKTEATKSLEECDQVLPEGTEKEENKLTPEEEQELVKKEKRRKVQTRVDDKKPKAARKKTAKEDSEIEVVVHKTEATKSLEECDQVLPEGTEKKENKLTPEEEQELVKKEKRRKVQTRGNDNKPKAARKKTAKEDSETEVVDHKTEATESLEECDQVLPEGTEKEENKLIPEEEQELVKKEKRRKVQTRGDDKKPKAARKKTAKEDSEIEVVVHKTEATKSLEECDQVLPEGTEKEENNLTPEEEPELVKEEKRRKVQTRGDDNKPKAARKKPAKEDSEIESEETTSVQEQIEGEKTETEKGKSGLKKKKQEFPEPGLESRKTRKRKVPVDAPVEESEKKPKLGAEAKTEKTTGKTGAKKLVAKKGTTTRGGAKGDTRKKKTEEDIVIKVDSDSDAEDPKMANAVVAKTAKFVGAHMSMSGGLVNAVKDAVATGSKAFALFLRSQRQWAAKPLEDKPAEKFRTACQEHKFPPHLILPHGSYLLNCGSPSDETLRKSREALVDELKRCEKLGLTRYNFHPGSTCGDITVEECLDKIGETINLVHQQTNEVMTVIENMSCQGNTVGGKFEELSGIIERVKDKSRIGVCLDTCHAFAAGFDLSSESGYQDMMADFDRIIGLKYLVAVHLNDSKGKVGSHLDRHENIGKGQIGLKAFQLLMNDSRFDNIPLILETPVGDGVDYAKEIKLLNSMVGKT